MKNRLSILTSCLVLAAFTAGCAGHSNLQPASQIENEFSQANKNTNKEVDERTSEAVHQFLISRLNLADRNYDAAQAALQRTAELVGDSDPSINGELAELSLKKGDFDLALTQSERAFGCLLNSAKPCTKSPAVDSSITFATLLQAGGRSVDASKVYEIILSQSPARLEPLVLSPLIWNAQQQHLLTDKYLTPIVNTPNPPVLAVVALAYSKELRNEFKSAIELYKKSIGLDPGDPSLYLNLLRIALKANDSTLVTQTAREMRALADRLRASDDAQTADQIAGIADKILSKESYSEVLSGLINGESQEFSLEIQQMKLALAFAQRQRFADSARQLLVILARSPESSSARYLLASMYAASGDVDEAVDELIKIKATDDLFVRSRTFAAILLKQRQNYSRADAVLTDALKVDPDNQLLTNYLISVLREGRMLDKAESLIRQEIKKEPNNERLYMALSEVLDAKGQSHEAVLAMKEVLRINPNNPEALNYIAYSVADGEAPSSSNLLLALAQIEQALAQRPNDGYFIDTKAWILFRLGRLEDARREAERALSFTGPDSVLLEHLGDILRALGQNNAAKDTYSQALDLVINKLPTKRADKKEVQDELREDEAQIERLKQKIRALTQ
jgi:tetratricopeptide (TPR) repeat protein